MLENALAHYSKCDYVKYIHVVWCESKLPPERLIQRFSPLKNPTIYFDVLEDSLNNRFSPLQEGTYTDGIFSVDDDIRVSCQDLKLTHEVVLKYSNLFHICILLKIIYRSGDLILVPSSDSCRGYI